MFDLDSLDRHLAARAREANAPGLAVAAVRERDVCYAQGFGATSVEAGGVPITPETLFHIASTTKPVTGTAVMRLVERGSWTSTARCARTSPGAWGGRTPPPASRCACC